MSVARRIRITLLLLILLGVAFDAWYTNQRMTDWQEPIWLAIFPVYGDQSPNTIQFIADLSAEDFGPLELYLSSEVRRYGSTLARPVEVKLAPPEQSLPPLPPRDGGFLDTVAWSFKLRRWANDAEQRMGGTPPDIRMFVIYHDPELAPAVPHSLGLKKGLVGIVHAFAVDQMQGSNLVVITHELLHTLGATDKYDPTTNLPRWPEGFADPGAQPTYPQAKAEIMAGRIPVTDRKADIPAALHETVIGHLTAQEINLIP